MVVCMLMNVIMRMRMRVEYTNNQKFGSETVIQFAEEPAAEEKKR